MACNVCGEETGWAENPLVYCDGNDGHCSVAVHQACYGITSVPSGAWLCGKCISLERKAKVRCELCPSKDGAFKRTSSGNFAHVVCSLYIPEVQFGNVTTMEPIILSSIPSDRFHKNCYICEDRGKEAKAKIGACMQCNKSGCKHYFHVTCGQAEGLLCEEAANNDDNVKYCGYCKHHFQKLRKDPHIKFIPAFKPEKQRSEKGNSSPKMKKSHHNSDSTSKPPKKKQKFYGTSNLDDSDTESNKHEKHEKHDKHGKHEKHEKEKVKRKRTSSSSKDLSVSTSSNLNKHSSSKETSSLFGKESDNESLSSSESNIISTGKKSRDIAFDSDTDDEVQFKKNKSDFDKKKVKKSSFSKSKDNEKIIEKTPKESKKIKKRKDESSINKATTKSSLSEEINSSINKVSKNNVDDKRNEQEKNSNAKPTNHKEISNEKVNSLKKISTVDKEPEVQKEQQEKELIEPEPKKELPKQDFNLPELIKYNSSILTEEESQKPIQSFEELLERQWNQTAQFLMEQSQFFDISSLISCLFQLKSENRTLEEKLKSLKQKRDHLIAVNSRLSIPLNGLDNWDSSNNGQLALASSNSITNNSTNTSNSATHNNNDAATNLFYQNQNTLAANFSSIHNASTSTPSPTTSQQKQSQSNSFFNLNNLNVNNINSSLNNQSFNLSNSKSLDLNSNLNNTFFDATNLKQQTPTPANNFHYNNNGLFQAVNGQFNLNSNLSSASNTSSPSKLTASFNNSLTNSANNSNLLPTQLFQNFLQNQSHAFSLNQQTVQNTVLNGNQSKR